MATSKVVYAAITILFFTFSFTGQLPADPPDMTWGEVPMEQLLMDHFPADSNAAAVILFDYGKSAVAEDYYTDHYRHRRIKILTADGYDWGTHSIRYRAERRAQRVHDIEAHTINIDENGNVTRHVMDKDAIFDEDIDGSLRQIRFTLPAIQPGSVIEYRYRVDSNNATFLPDWRFQYSEPVLWSEYHARIPNILRYVQVIEGTHRPYKTDQVRYQDRNIFLDGTHFTWIMKDLPAIRREPFISTPDDYMTKLRFQLAAIQLPGYQPRRYLDTWEELVDELAVHRDFGRVASGTRRIRREARDLVDDITDPVEKMKIIYRYIQTSIVWDGRYRVFPSDNLHATLDNHTGNSADIAMLLTAMLRAVDIEADPVILSTRSNGRIQNLYPIVGQFNHVIARVQIGRQYYLLDATDPYIPVGMLPYQAMSNVGLLVKRGEGQWIMLGSSMGTRRTIESHLQMDHNGAIEGTLALEERGYDAASRRRQYDTNTREEFLENLFGEARSLIEVDTLSVVNKDQVEEPLVIELAISSIDYVSAVGEYIYLDPWITGHMNDNPLRIPERTFPVEFVYPRESEITIELTIPENFDVVDLPRPVTHRLGNAGHYRTRLRLSGNVITLRREFELRQVTFEPEEYPELREFFGKVVAHDNQQIVLRRTGSEAEVSGSNE